MPYVPTYMTRMDAAGVSYRIYGQGHSPTTPPDQAIDYCDYFTECLTTTAQRESDVNISGFLSDVSTNSLPQFSVLLPFQARTDVSQHNGTSMLSGDDYINQIVSAIAGSPTLWPHTVIFVTYDDCGCQYDHQNALATSLGHGLRAPMLIISPWVKPGSTDSTTAVGIGSVLAFTEHTFGVRPLTSLDGSAYDYADSFDFTSGGRAPRPDLPGLHGISLAEQLQLTAEVPRVDADGT